MIADDSDVARVQSPDTPQCHAKIGRSYSNRIGSQCIKELAQFRRDPITVGLAFLLPLMALLLYGYATRLEIKDLPLAVINYDNGKLSRTFIERLFASNQLVPIKWHGADPAEPLDKGIARGTVVIPPEFSRKIKAGTPMTIQAVVDATDVNNARVIRNSLNATTSFFLQTEELSKFRSILEPETRLWFNPGREEALYIVPGTIGLVLWVFPSLLSAIALAREKEQGTILQLYASSMSAFELMSGKLLAYIIVAVMEGVVVIAASMILFGLAFQGSILGFALNLVLYVACATNFGLFAGAVARTQSAAVQIVATVGFTSTLLLSGFIYPIRNIVYPLNLLSVIVPARYFMEACRDAFVRGPEPFSHWYIPLALLAANLVLIRASSTRMSAMQLRS